MLTCEVIRMSVKYEVLKKLVAAAGLKKRWLSAATEELLENRRKQNADCSVLSGNPDQERRTDPCL